VSLRPVSVISALSASATPCSATSPAKSQMTVLSRKMKGSPVTSVEPSITRQELRT
jgi:hypothetical protein